MTETMLEKMAKAIAKSAAANISEWDPHDEHSATAIARAALEVIREPSGFLASKVFYEATSTAKAAEHEERFTAMIDAILSQSQEGK